VLEQGLPVVPQRREDPLALRRLARVGHAHDDHLATVHRRREVGCGGHGHEDRDDRQLVRRLRRVAAQEPQDLAGALERVHHHAAEHLADGVQAETRTR
jgi:hypothetical protein